MEKWIEVMLNNSILMSVVILLLLLLSKLFFKRNSAKWRYYTWLIVIIGLLIPFRPTFDIIPVRIEPPIQISVQNINPVISEQPEPDGLMNISEIQSSPVSPLNKAIMFHWYMLVMVIWIVGFLASLMYYFLKHRRFLKAVGRWSRDADREKVSALLDEVKTELGITRGLKLKICKIISTPMLIGFVNPVILLPPNDFECDELELIIRHELTHHKRKDLLYKALVLFTNAVHWFNPFVYIMARAISTDCEMSCDEVVLRNEDLPQRMLYGETIISIIKNQSSVSTVFSTGFKGGKKSVEQRMFSIMDITRKKAGVMILCAVLACTLLTGMVSTANAQQLPKPNNQTAIPGGQKVETDHATEYAQWGITISDEIYYCNGVRIRIFTDIRANNSFEMAFMDEAGSVDVRLVRDNGGKIIRAELISEEDATELMRGFNNGKNGKIEDVDRLEIEEAPQDVQEAIRLSCSGNGFYIIKGNDRQYVYYNNLTGGYAYQVTGSTVRIVDLIRLSKCSVLLSLPADLDLSVNYNSNVVTCTVIEI